ncbi:rRNA biogenesis protein rrp5, partial [Tulasnella sp. 403]
AREVGRRAVEVINYREEQEKLNIWLALLNLEIEHGTEESLRSVFNDACKMNDAKTIHLRLAGLLDEAEKYEDAEEMYNRAIKRFSTSSKVWTSFGKYYLQRGKLDDARELLPRSLKSLEKRKHLKTITKFAQLEYQLGDPERGKTIFEGVISSHPKRLDLWSIYIDQEAKAENVDTVRHIFNRLIKLKLSSKKARSFFKKWLELERTIGDEDGAEVVKTKAIEWTRQNGLAGES